MNKRTARLFRKGKYRRQLEMGDPIWDKVGYGESTVDRLAKMLLDAKGLWPSWVKR